MNHSSTPSIHLVFILFLVATSVTVSAQSSEPVRMGVAGLVHDHVHQVFREQKDGDYVIVGIAEQNRELAQAYAKRYGFDIKLVYPTLDAMLEATDPEVVSAYNAISDHLEVVQKCAPQGVHVMVEKPLAVNLDHARQMEKLARKHNIHLVTNYETSWYGTTQHALDQARKGELGDLRKIIVRDGHEGPKEIGCSAEFLHWLTDPRTNGAGALMDFGCYGANLTTALMNNQRPVSVTAIALNIKPDIYPKVDDDATIVVTYPHAQAIIQASWNWPFGRKDMEIYGVDGYIRTIDGQTMYSRLEGTKGEEKSEVQPIDTENSPFTYLVGVIRGAVKMGPESLSSLENNMIAMEILDAALRSVKEGKTIDLK